MTAPPEVASRETVIAAADLPVVPARRPWRWVASVVAAVLLAMALNALVTNPAWDWSVAAQYLFYETILRPVWVTLQLTVLAIVIGFALGTVLALMRLSRSPVLVGFSWGYVWLFRSVPLILQLLFWFNLALLYERLSVGVPFGPEFFDVRTQDLIGPMTAATLGLGLHQAAYSFCRRRCGPSSPTPATKSSASVAEALNLVIRNGKYTQVLDRWVLGARRSRRARSTRPGCRASDRKHVRGAAMTVNTRPVTVLDNPVWAALTGPHARFAQVLGRAARYDPDVTRFATLADRSDPKAWADLATLVGSGGSVALSGDAIEPPPGWQVQFRGAGVQLVDDSLVTADDPEAVTLGAADIPEILDLVERTQPGPFLARTHELGIYLGIRRGGRLVALAGERLHPPGWTEISAVCTDEAFRGQGLATRLVRAVAAGIRRRGETPFMHAAATNTNAIRLYESIGFRLRKRTVFAMLTTP